MTTPPDPAPTRPSLLHRLLRDVMVPLALTWAVGTAVMIGVASHFTQQAFDRSLLDDAYLVASNVHLEGSRLALALSPREVGSVLFDQDEKAFLALVDPAGEHIEGTQGLHAPAPAGDAVYRFSYIQHGGRINFEAHLSAMTATTMHDERRRCLDLVEFRHISAPDKHCMPQREDCR